MKHLALTVNVNSPWTSLETIGRNMSRDSPGSNCKNKINIDTKGVRKVCGPRSFDMVVCIHS